MSTTSPEPPPTRKLPDPAICRAKSARFGEYADCLVHLPVECGYAFHFGDGYLCIHPKRAEIIARTKLSFSQ